MIMRFRGVCKCDFLHLLPSENRIFENKIGDRLKFAILAPICKNYASATDEFSKIFDEETLSFTP